MLRSDDRGVLLVAVDRCAVRSAESTSPCCSCCIGSDFIYDPFPCRRICSCCQTLQDIPFTNVSIEASLAVLVYWHLAEIDWGEVCCLSSFPNEESLVVYILYQKDRCMARSQIPKTSLLLRSSHLLTLPIGRIR